ncbi:Ger(x)C family spore germination protein [Paenibacillus harenae]|uniref:Spore germination protein KC n=1 Tax=Paenibacillus harenae TaxID=306543 RepID=A0ABT9U3I2_PAEHA|nr:Ger(x)C family spore germination protein [Paenibacillus harenae]MDQ0113009.1 spore germination protein KC [Paenibacillus harenae]
MKGWRLLPGLLALLACLPLAGCWNRVELSDIAIVSATGVDWKDGQWQLSYQVVIPQAISGQSPSADSGAAVNVFSTRGENFRGAISKASLETPRRLFFAHNQIVIIGQEAARKGISTLAEAYLRTPDSRETVSVFLTKGSARRVLEQLIPLEKIPGAAIQQMVFNEELNGSTFQEMTMHKVLENLLGSAQAVGIPSLAITGTGESLDQADKLARTNTPSKVRLLDLGIVSGDKLVGWITKEESSGVMWITDQIKKSTVSFACPDDGENKVSSIRITKASTKLRPQRSGDKWTMHVETRAEGTLLEYNCGGDMMQPKQVDATGQAIAQSIKGTMESGWKAVAKYKSDVLGFGDLIHRKHPGTWKQIKGEWPDLFARMDVKIQVKVRVNSTGMSGNSFKKVQEKARS